MKGKILRIAAARDWGKALLPLFFIVILSVGMSTYYLRLNPDHILIYDDSYITLKFASNFFKYKGISYDGTSYFFGATSPLHIVCIALLGLFFKIETASLFVGIIFFSLSSILAYLWVLRIYEHRGIALLAGTMMSTNPSLIFDSLSGLETTTFICFALLAFYVHYSFRNKVWYAIPLSLCVLTRPEGWFIASALWSGELVHYSIKKDTRILTRLACSFGIFLLCMSPYFLLLFYHTGSPLPSTVLSKCLFFHEFSIPLSEKIGSLKGGIQIFYMSFYPLPLFIFPLVVFARNVLSLISLWLYFIFFYLFYLLLFPGAIGHYWSRYQHIFIPIIIIVISGGFFELLSMCKRRVLQISVGVLLLTSIIYNQSKPIIYLEDFYVRSVDVSRKVIELALWLRDHTAQNSLIAVHDIGTVGYFSDRKIIDLVGLVNPEMNKYYWSEGSKKPLSLQERKVIDYLKEKKPDYLVMFKEWDRYFNFFQPDDRKYFEEVAVPGILFPEGMKYEVFECNLSAFNHR